LSSQNGWHQLLRPPSAFGHVLPVRPNRTAPNLHAKHGDGLIRPRRAAALPSGLTCRFAAGDHGDRTTGHVRPLDPWRRWNTPGPRPGTVGRGGSSRGPASALGAQRGQDNVAQPASASFRDRRRRPKGSSFLAARSFFSAPTSAEPRRGRCRLDRHAGLKVDHGPPRSFTGQARDRSTSKTWFRLASGMRAESTTLALASGDEEP